MVDMDALLAEHLGPVEREFERERTFREQLVTAEVEVRSPDKTITVTQTCAGEIRDIRIAPGAFGKHDERSLAEALKKALQDGREVGRQAAVQLTDTIMNERGTHHGSR